MASLPLHSSHALKTDSACLPPGLPALLPSGLPVSVAASPAVPAFLPSRPPALPCRPALPSCLTSGARLTRPAPWLTAPSSPPGAPAPAIPVRSRHGPHVHVRRSADGILSVGVGLGVFGAHGLRGRLSPEMLAVFETGVRYHMYHALALLATAALMSRSEGRACHGRGLELHGGDPDFPAASTRSH